MPKTRGRVHTWVTWVFFSKHVFSAKYFPHLRWFENDKKKKGHFKWYAQAKNGEETLHFKNAENPPTDPRSQIKGGRSSGRAGERRVRGESRRAGVKKSENKQHNTVGQMERLEGVTLPEGWFMTKSGKCCLSHNVCTKQHNAQMNSVWWDLFPSSRSLRYTGC